MRMLIFAIFFATTAFDLFLRYLYYSSRNAPLPENVRDVFDSEAYKKNQAYLTEKLKFLFISGLVGAAVTLAFLGFNFHHMLYGFVSARTANIYLTSMFILLVPIAIAGVVRSLLGVYDTFVTEARYGFNKSTVGTFVADFVKMMLLQLILMGGLLALFLFLHRQIGDRVFFAFFFVLIAFQLLLAFLSPLILRLTYKFTPLEEGELKTKIEALAQKTGYKLKGIYVVNASKRTTKMNAFATGFGKTKTIGLHDTLVEKLSHDEIVSILAHEIGHAKKHHILKRMPLFIVEVAIIVAVAYFVVVRPEVSMAFGFAGANMAFGIFVLFTMLQPVNIVLSIPERALSRKHEYEADAFEVEHCGAQTAISALKKAYRDGLGDLTPHPLVVKLKHNHPTLSQRITAMEKVGNAGERA